MERKLKLNLWLASIVLFISGGSLIVSCSKSSDPITSEITQTVNDESTQDAQQDEVDDITTGQLNRVDGAGSRIASHVDRRVSCANISFDTTSNKAEGGITINFDENPDGSANPAGCMDSAGNIRKGSIIIGWNYGRWFKINSMITITLSNYSINGVVINGTRGLTNITTIPAQPSWQVISSVTSTWPDNTNATRLVSKTRLWNIANGTITLTQTAGDPSAATGTNRHGTNYSVSITNGLVYSAVCLLTNKVYVPISGTKVITIDTSKEITIDFGSGTCDNTFTITFDGKSETLNARNDASAD